MTEVFHSASSEILTSLLTKQIPGKCQLCLSVAAHTEKPVITVQDTHPGRCNAIVHHSCQIVKDCEGKMKAQCMSSPCRQRIVISLLQNINDEKDNKQQRGTNKSIDSGKNSKTVKSEKDRYSLVTITSKVVPEIPRKEVSDITEPLLVDVSDTDYEQLESGSLLEIRIVTDDIAEVIVDSLDNRDSTGKVESKLSLNKVGSKIRTFLLNSLSKHHSTNKDHIL